MIIDCHGHYTTAPDALGDYREAQRKAVEADPRHVGTKGSISITEAEIRVGRGDYAPGSGLSGTLPDGTPYNVATFIPNAAAIAAREETVRTVDSRVAEARGKMAADQQAKGGIEAQKGARLKAVEELTAVLAAEKAKRLQKLAGLRDEGTNPYPYRFEGSPEECAAAALADDAERFPALEPHAHAIHRPHRPGASPW
mgnify:CR=1 FL=1